MLSPAWGFRGERQQRKASAWCSWAISSISLWHDDFSFFISLSLMNYFSKILLWYILKWFLKQWWSSLTKDLGPLGLPKGEILSKEEISGVLNRKPDRSFPPRVLLLKPDQNGKNQALVSTNHESRCSDKLPSGYKMLLTHTCTLKYCKYYPRGNDDRFTSAQPHTATVML